MRGFARVRGDLGNSRNSGLEGISSDHRPEDLFNVVRGSSSVRIHTSEFVTDRYPIKDERRKGRLLGRGLSTNLREYSPFGIARVSD